MQKKESVSENFFQNQIRSIGGRILDKINDTGLYKVASSPKHDIEPLLSTAQALDSVASAETNFAYTLCPSPLLSDPSLQPTGESPTVYTLSANPIAVLDSGLIPETLSLPWITATYDAHSRLHKFRTH